MRGSAPEDSIAQRYQFMLDHTREFITLINRDYVYELVSTSYCAAIEKEREEVVGRTVAEIWGPERFDASIKGYIDRCFAGETVSYLERFQFGPQKRYMQVSFHPYPGGEGAPTHAFVSSHDITHLGELEQMLMNYEYRDPVTGLFNRKSLEILLEVELLKAQRGSAGELRSLVFIEIENLAEINRRHGYDIGDHIVENTGTRVKELVRDSDYVFRSQGNELAVILTHLASDADVAKVAAKIVQAISTPYRFRDADIVVSCRAGAAMYPADGATVEILTKNAAAALADAVREQREFKRYDSDTHREASRRLDMETKLRHAFEQEQFELYFQPIIRAAGGIEGAEALIRWNLPQRGIVRPGEFLPIARESGMMEAISRWAIFAAVRQLARLRARRPFYVTVNLTARDFESDELPKMLLVALEQANGQVVPSQLKLEITESDAMHRADVAITRMEALQAMGFEVFVDDFGTGHSSLSYLRSLPASTVKIDKSFVDALAGDASDEPFVRYIVELLKVRGKRVVAEGVTTFEQVERLTRMGCDSLQGYYFAEPLPLPAFEAFLEQHANGAA